MVKLCHAILQLVEFHAVARAAKGVGEDEIGTGTHHGLVMVEHPLWEIDIPEFRRIAGFQTTGKKVGTGRAIGDQHLARRSLWGRS